MAENITRPTEASVRAFLDTVENPVRRADADVLLELFERVTGEKPVMWGPAIIGYGSYHYRYESGREGDMCRAGFSPRKAALSLYLTCDAARFADILSRLGKHKTGKGCIYVTKLADVDMAVLEELVRDGWEEMQRKYPLEN